MVFLREQYPGLISRGNFVLDSLRIANKFYERLIAQVESFLRKNAGLHSAVTLKQS